MGKNQETENHNYLPRMCCEHQINDYTMRKDNNPQGKIEKTILKKKFGNLMTHSKT